MKPEFDFQTKFPFRKLAGKAKPPTSLRENKPKLRQFNLTKAKSALKFRSHQIRSAWIKFRDICLKIAKALQIALNFLKTWYSKTTRFIDFCIYKQDNK